MLSVSVNKQDSPDEVRRSVRIADNINYEYRQKFEAIENSIKEYRDGKQEIFVQEQLLPILDKKAGGAVDRDVFMQLFNRVKKSERNEFFINDWVNVYLEAEEILNSKISTDSIKLNQYYAVENQMQTLLQEELFQLSNKPATGKNENCFWLNIFEAEITKGSDRSEFENPVSIAIEVGNQQFRTKPSDNLRAPLWNENFKIKIEDPSLKKVKIKCVDSEKKEYGFHTFELLAFNDSKKKKAWLQLSSNKEMANIVKIHLSAVLLDSRIDKLQQDINLNDSKIAETSRRVTDFQQMLEELHRPFRSLNVLDERNTVKSQPGRPSVFRSEYTISKNEKNLVDTLHRYTAKYVKNWAKAFLMASAIVITLNTVLCFQKPAFFDYVILIYILGRLFIQELTNQELRVCLIVSAVSILFDFVWLCVNWKNWCAIDPRNLPDCKLKNHLLWAAMLLLPVKFCFSIIIWRNSVRFADFREQIDLLLNTKKPFMD